MTTSTAPDMIIVTCEQCDQRNRLPAPPPASPTARIVCGRCKHDLNDGGDVKHAYEEAGWVLDPLGFFCLDDLDGDDL